MRWYSCQQWRTCYSTARNVSKFSAHFKCLSCKDPDAYLQTQNGTYFGYSDLSRLSVKPSHPHGPCTMAAGGHCVLVRNLLCTSFGSHLPGSIPLADSTDMHHAARSSPRLLAKHHQARTPFQRLMRMMQKLRGMGTSATTASLAKMWLMMSRHNLAH